MTVKLVTMPADAITLCTIPMVFVSFSVSPDLFSIVLTFRWVNVVADVILSVWISVLFFCFLEYLQISISQSIQSNSSQSGYQYLIGEL